LKKVLEGELNYIVCKKNTNRKSKYYVKTTPEEAEIVGRGVSSCGW
jgi:hypothetical protein